MRRLALSATRPRSHVPRPALFRYDKRQANRVTIESSAQVQLDFYTQSFLCKLGLL